ncbi:MFS transporter [Streptomyces sp. NPDC038707]|uniref:MFS transporter n=1 Tax=Streptomyces achromogenes subsp. streptozoticus TaxID=285532 RepID=A0A411EVU8_STRC2|nr:MFS transporter [Streptomyces achromogenes subsp. streptozoticus]QBA82205.1 MFS transporter [Streptomyces achromogenes subsp. streptozoticus]QBF29333.1 MFS-type transporter [Streptomyces achromogenes subsp. streptozoticus]
MTTGQTSAGPGKAGRPSVLETLRGIPGPIWLVLVGMLVNRLGNFLQIYLVLYLTAKGFSATEAGFALGAYGVGSVVGVLVGGSASDRIGYAWTIVGSMALAGLGTLSLPHLGSLPLVIVVAAVIGLLAQMYRPASSALLVERTPEHHHVMVFAVYRMAFNLGTTVGPLLGALLISHSYNLIFYLEAGAQLSFAVFALVLARSGGMAEQAERHADAPRRSYAAVLRDTRYVLFLLALFLNAVVYIQHTSALPLQIKADGHGVAFYSSLLSLNAVMVICLELLFTKYVQHLPGKVAVALGIGLVGVGMNLYVAGPGMAMYVVATVVWTAGEMIGTPTASAWPGKVAPEHLRGRYIAAAAFPMQIGYAVGPVLGVAAWQLSHASVWWLSGLLTVGAVAATLAGMSERRTDHGTGTAEAGEQPAGHGGPVAADTP